MNEASRWRIDAARRLSQPYAGRSGVQTIVLAGSAAKGLADDWSDLDVVVVWDEPDVAFLDTAPLPGGERFTDLASDDGSRVEQYFVGALKVDVASMRRDALDELIDDVVVRADTDPMKQKVAQGFTEGVTLHGPAVHDELRARLASFPDELVTALVTRHLRLLPLWAPQRMGLDRDDPIAYADMILVDVRAVLSVLAALNRRYWSVTPEAKWNRYLLDHCPLAPPETERRLRRLLDAPSSEAIEDFGVLLGELVDLVEQHAPAVDTRGARRMLELRLDPCPTPPPLP